MADNKKWTLTLRIDEGVKTYELRDDKGTIVSAGPASKALVKAAWANGADSVRHDYDLKHAENEP